MNEIEYIPLVSAKDLVFRPDPGVNLCLKEMQPLFRYNIFKQNQQFLHPSVSLQHFKSYNIFPFVYTNSRLHSAVWKCYGIGITRRPSLGFDVD